MFWACVRTEPKRELVAKHFLELAGYQVYVPRVREQRIRNHRKLEILAPLFPCYAFIVIDQQWHTARRSIGVASLVMDGERPARVPDQVVDAIRRREVRGALELPKAPDFTPGDPVRVLAGPFEGITGLYSGQGPRQRVEILLAVLGRVSLPRGGVELA
jgi:transcriptional antiterminator RfaH